MRAATSVVVLLALAACSEDAAFVSYSEGNDNDYYDTGDIGGSEDADGDTQDTAPPEEEDDFLALQPSQTDVYVFIANPGRGTVTRVDVNTLEVRTTEVGNNPRLVLTTPDYATAVVFNKNDDSVTLLDADTLEQTTLPVRDDMNRMVMSPNGRWVALWYDPDAVDPDDPPPDGIQSYNEVSFVDVENAIHHPMAVDTNPREIQFTPDSSLSAVVTDTSLGIVDLGVEGALIPRIVPVTDELVDPPQAEEVVVAPDGSYAFVRQFGVEELVIVDLLTENVQSVPVGLNPTDLDLTPDGTRAVVVARGSHEVWMLDVADPFAPPEVLSTPPEVNLGSVLLDPTGDQAILYTTATLTDLYASWDVASGEITLRQLVKPVQSMAITPTGESLLVIHTKADASGADPNSQFYGEWAITLVSLDDLRRTNPLRLPAEAIGWTNSNNGNYGYFIMDGEPYLEVLDYTTLLPYEVELRSHPVYVGVLPDLDSSDGDEPHAWASQEHELGRISFYDPDDESVETITGFELNSAIED